jgi:hypothetical protein
MRTIHPFWGLVLSLTVLTWPVAVLGQWDDEGEISEGDVYEEEPEGEAEEGYIYEEEGAEEPSEVIEDTSYFFDRMAPHGEWLWTPEYGWVWRPNGVWDDWRPYTYGRWVYTSQGWTWSSFFPWGWAAFHYGSWAHMDYMGWVWVPGIEWAPAWVIWRNSDSYIGWAPMLAGYDLWFGWAYYPIYYSHWTFTRWRHFCDPHPHHHYVPRRGVPKIFRHTYYPRRCRDSGSASCGRGPTSRLVTKRTGLPVKTHKIENLAVRPRVGGPQVRSTGVQGDVLKMYRPKLDKSHNVAQPGSAANGRLRHTKDLGIVQDRVPRPSRVSPGASVSGKELGPSSHPAGVIRGPDRRPSPGKSIYPKQPKTNRPSMHGPSVRYPRPSGTKAKNKGFRPVPSRKSTIPRRILPKSGAKSRPGFVPSKKTYSPKSKSSTGSKSKSGSSKSRSSYRSSSKSSTPSFNRSSSRSSGSSRSSSRRRR